MINGHFKRDDPNSGIFLAGKSSATKWHHLKICNLTDDRMFNTVPPPGVDIIDTSYIFLPRFFER
jgi:hypothetical protein